MQPRRRLRGPALTAALWGATVAASAASAAVVAAQPADAPPPQAAPEPTRRVPVYGSPPDRDPPQTAVPVYGVPPTHDVWEVQGRVRAAGPLMGMGPAEGIALFPARAALVAAEVAIGPITVEGGYTLRMGGHAAAQSGFFNVGGAWTFADGYATGEGAWQGRVGGTLGYDVALSEYGDYGFERWHALGVAAVVDGTWWFTRSVGLELRLAIGAQVALAFASHDSPHLDPPHDLSRGDVHPYALATVGLAFGRWHPF